MRIGLPNYIQLEELMGNFVQVDRWFTNLSSLNVGDIVPIFCSEINNKKHYIVTNTKDKTVEFSEICGSVQFIVSYER